MTSYNILFRYARSFAANIPMKRIDPTLPRMCERKLGVMDLSAGLNSM